MINFFVEILKARAAEDMPKQIPLLPKCHFMTSQFYPKLAETASGFKYENVKRWTKKVKLFAFDLVVVPIHCHGNRSALFACNL